MDNGYLPVARCPLSVVDRMAKRKPRTTIHGQRTAFTLTELVAVVAILGVLAVLIVPRLSGHLATSKSAACKANKADIELQVKLWRRNNGSYPPANLGTIGTNPTYFPSGLSTCPVTGTPYTIDTTTGLVTGHSH